ncbi:MAG: hypothetical protein Q4G51_04755 [Dermatophilus congolensis]|nr:hypothetical protein [Dermatophilus congolensis]
MNSERPGSPSSTDETHQDQVLAWLGLPSGASTEDIEATHERLVSFLGSAPLVLQPWARRQADAADTAKAALLDPDVDAQEALASARAADVPRAAAEAAPVSAAATTSGAGSAAAAGSAASMGLADDRMAAQHFDDDVIDTAPPARAAAPAAPVVTGKQGKNPTTVLLLALLAVAVVIGVYFMGGGGDESTQAGSSPTASADAAAAMGATPIPVDPAKIKEFTAKVEANPKDTASMRELANMYFGAADFTNAAVWQSKVIEITPKDTEARLALGAAKFNSGDMAEAEKQWREVQKIDPKNAESHYNMGFLYLSKTPPQLDQAEAEWAKVAELAPNTELAKTATAHLDRLKNAPTMGTTAGTNTGTATPGTPAPAQSTP